MAASSFSLSVGFPQGNASTFTDWNTDMKFMLTHVIPRVAYKWEMLSSFLEYTIAQKKIIKQEHRGAPRECCVALLEDWIITDNGVGPKTLGKFVEVLEEIGDLAQATREIKKLLKIEKEAQRLKDAAKLNLDPNCDTTEDSNDLMQSSGTGATGPGDGGGHATLMETPLTGEHSQVPCTDDLTEPDGASCQEEGTIGSPNHPSSSSKDQPSTYSIFISYGRGAINDTFAKNLVGILEGEHFAVFRDTKDIDVGDKLSEKLSQGVRNHDAFIVIFSGKYNKSYWCKQELEIARDGKKLVLPIRRERKDYLNAVDFHLTGYKYLDFFADDDISDDPEHFAQAFGELMRCLNKKAAEKKRENELVT